jgi:hypothetical protein
MGKSISILDERKEEMYLKKKERRVIEEKEECVVSYY